jgi:hypothetical protein
MIIDEESVSATLDALNAAMFEGRELRSSERTRVARWLASRHGLSGAYANTFAGFERERKAGILTFTGERITSASARHILGEETCRALRLLRVSDPTVTQALESADQGLQERLKHWRDVRHGNPGLFCCSKCSVGFWRNLLSGGLDKQRERLRQGVGELRKRRDGRGKWQGFPFWYAVLALCEMEGPEAKSELKYAAPLFERAIKRAPAATPYAQRRHELARRALERI